MDLMATCFPNSCFCEGLQSGIIFQPINALSSLAFVIAGLFIFWRHRDGFGAIYSTLLVFIGLGSAYYHARLDFLGQTIDNLGMYLLITLAMVPLLAQRYKQDIDRMWVRYLAFNILLTGLIIEVPEIRRYVFAILVGIFILLAKKSRSADKHFNYALLSISFAFIFWTLDITDFLCAPNSILQGHALWHILGAISGIFLFLFVKSASNSKIIDTARHARKM